MHTRIISFLGTTWYDYCLHEVPSHGVRRTKQARLTDIPLLDVALSGTEDTAEVVVIGTDAVWKQWFNEGRVGECAYVSDLTDDRPTWRERVSVAFIRTPDGVGVDKGTAGKGPARRVEIELWEVYRAIDLAAGAASFEALAMISSPPFVESRLIHTARCGAGPDRIFLDLTNGFRAQPIFGVNALRRLAESRSQLAVPDLTLFYTAFVSDFQGGKYAIRSFDRKDGYQPKRQESEADVCPVVDVTSVLSASRWLTAASSFRLYGRADDLAGLCREVQRLAVSEQGLITPVQKLGDAARDFADALCTLRLNDLVTSNAARLASASADVREHERASLLLPVLAPEFHEIEKMAKDVSAPELESQRGLRALLSVATLADRFERFAECAAVIRETIVIAFALAVRDGRILRPDAKKRPSIEAKDAESWLGAGVGVLKALPDGPFRTFAETFGRVGDLRNDLLHGGLRETPRPSSTIRRELKEALGQLEKLLQFVENGDIGERLPREVVPVRPDFST